MVDSNSMMHTTELDEIINKVNTTIVDKAVFAVLFGSVLSDRFTIESDIDIGVFFKQHSADFDTFWDVKSELQSVLNRDIDLISMNTSDTIITMQILANGRLILTNDPGLFCLYKAQKTSEYFDFKLDRKIIEDNMMQGRIYA